MFDIHQKVIDECGEVDDQRFADYCEGLMKAFAESPEGQGIVDRFNNVGWVHTMMDFGMNYLGVTPADMTAREFDEVVFTLFPRKVSVEPERAEEIIGELAAFWGFVSREYHLPHASEILTTLVPASVDELERELADSSNYGIAKSMFMTGMKAGYDMTTEEGMSQFVLEYNASIAARNQTSVFGRPHFVRQRSPDERRELQRARNKRKKKLKLTSKSRKRNRR